MYFSKKQFLIIIFILMAIFPFFSFASEIRLDSNKTEIKTEEQFVVNVILYTENSVNAVEGQVKFDSNILAIKEIRDGNSSINFWIEKPNLKSSGLISFSGITPGGFSGVNNLIFSIVFEAKDIGATIVSVENIKALLNDGLGSEEKISIHNTNIVIKKGDSNIPREDIQDTIPPESFSPTIAHDALIFNDKYFVIFATQDKNSGISHYEIKEYRFKYFSIFTPWKTIESPYILSDQMLKSYIKIKAVDNNDNQRISELNPANTLLWYEYILYWFIIIVIFMGIFYLISKIWKIKKN